MLTPYERKSPRVVLTKVVIPDRHSGTLVVSGYSVDVCPVENGEPTMPEVRRAADTTRSGEGGFNLGTLPNFPARKERRRTISHLHETYGVSSRSQRRGHDTPCQATAYYAD